MEVEHAGVVCLGYNPGPSPSPGMGVGSETPPIGITSSPSTTPITTAPTCASHSVVEAIGTVARWAGQPRAAAATAATGACGIKSGMGHGAGIQPQDLGRGEKLPESNQTLEAGASLALKPGVWEQASHLAPETMYLDLQLLEI